MSPVALSVTYPGTLCPTQLAAFSHLHEPRITQTYRTSLSHKLGPLPSSLAAPSTWNAAPATPSIKSLGKLHELLATISGTCCPGGKAYEPKKGGGTKELAGTAMASTVVVIFAWATGPTTISQRSGGPLAGWLLRCGRGGPYLRQSAPRMS